MSVDVAGAGSSFSCTKPGKLRELNGKVLRLCRFLVCENDMTTNLHFQLCDQLFQAEEWPLATQHKCCRTSESVGLFNIYTSHMWPLKKACGFLSKETHMVFCTRCIGLPGNVSTKSAYVCQLQSIILGSLLFPLCLALRFHLAPASC